MEDSELNDVSINWPEKSGIYKVVQLYVDGRPQLAIKADYGSTYHKNILSDFLAGRNVPFEMAMHRDGKEYLPDQPIKSPRDELAPKKSGERYRCSGMGYAEIDTKKKMAVFYGFSGTYWLRIDNNHLDEIRKLTDWSIELDESRM